MLLQRILQHLGKNFSLNMARLICTQNSAQFTKSYHYDIDEVKLHESVTDWWDPNGHMKALHAMNEIRVSLIRNSLVNAHQIKPEDACSCPTYLSGMKILDVGCGAGILSEAMARLGGHITGLDVSSELITQARRHAELSLTGLFPTYITSTIEEHAVQNPNLYDTVVASEVVEHVTNKESFVKSCISTLKPGGSLIITTPNRTWGSWLGGIILAEYILNIIPRGTHHYEKFITPTELSNMIEKRFVLTTHSTVFIRANNGSEPLQLRNISSDGTDSQSVHKDQVDFITAYLKNYYFYEPTNSESSEINSDNSTENGSLFSNSSNEIVLFLKSGNTSDVINQNTSSLSHSIRNSSIVGGFSINESLSSLNLSSNSVPLFYSLVIDTLPVHPRIPRTPPKRRKPYQNNRRYQQQRHRHSTRVILTKPARFLLPPSANKIKDITKVGFSCSDFFHSTPCTSTTLKQEMQQTSTTETNFKTSERSNTRSIFVPPPKRYLLPPFVDNNDLINYNTTTVAYFETSTQYTGLYYDTLPTTKVYSQQTGQYKPEENKINENDFVRFQADVTINNTESPKWEKDVSQTTYNWNITENYPKEFLQSRSEFYSSQHPETLTTTNNEKLWNSTIPTGQTTENYPSEYIENKSELYITVSTIKYEKYWNSTNFRSRNKTYNVNKSDRESTTREQFEQYIPTSTTSFPVITGRNVEQELFETGEFPAFVTADDTEPSTTPVFQDSHLSMMNKPLLSSDVASSGMKIIANVPSRLPEKKADSVENPARGRQRFNHFSQFKFKNSNGENNNKFISRRKEMPSKQSSQNRGLSVAETAYYRKRKISNQPHSQQDDGEIRVIPGVAGKDYPTLSKPPVVTSFSCKKYGNGHGYYADPSTGCQVFYVCTGDGPGEPMLCPNGTLFSQDFLVCDWWYNIDCHA